MSTSVSAYRRPPVMNTGLNEGVKHMIDGNPAIFADQFAVDVQGFLVIGDGDDDDFGDTLCDKGRQCVIALGLQQTEWLCAGMLLVLDSLRFSLGPKVIEGQEGLFWAIAFGVDALG